MENSVKNNEREKFDQSRCSHCVLVHIQLRNALRNSGGRESYKKPPSNTCISNHKRNTCNGQKPNTSFRCVSEDCFIKKNSKKDTLDFKNWSTENPELVHTY